MTMWFLKTFGNISCLVRNFMKIKNSKVLPCLRTEAIGVVSGAYAGAKNGWGDGDFW